eukprot:312873-Hanusia_phi.AAC.2
MEAHDGRGSQRQVVQGPPSSRVCSNRRLLIGFTGGGRPAQPMQFHNIPTLRPNVMRACRFEPMQRELSHEAGGGRKELHGAKQA